MDNISWSYLAPFQLILRKQSKTKEKYSHSLRIWVLLLMLFMQTKHFRKTQDWGCSYVLKCLLKFVCEVLGLVCITANSPKSKPVNKCKKYKLTVKDLWFRLVLRMQKIKMEDLIFFSTVLNFFSLTLALS